MASLKQRGDSFQIQFYVGTRQRRINLGPVPLQIAKEKLRQFESARLRGEESPFPTKTPIPEIVQAYVEHIRTHKTPKSAQIDVYYLREMFGPVCDGLRINNRRTGEQTRKRPLPKHQVRHRTPQVEANSLEDIATAQLSEFMATHTRRRGLAPKTANRYREIVQRLFNWAMTQRGVRMPGGRNPAAALERYHEPAPEIVYRTLPQIDEQLRALHDHPQLQAMVAVYIYAGLRREEVLWLTNRDVDLRAGLLGLIHVLRGEPFSNRVAYREQPGDMPQALRRTCARGYGGSGRIQSRSARSDPRGSVSARTEFPSVLNAAPIRGE